MNELMATATNDELIKIKIIMILYYIILR